MTPATLVEGNRAACRARSNRKPKGPRLGYRISEWSEMTGTSRQHTWRAIRRGALKAINYAGVTLIPDSERVRLGFEVWNIRKTPGHQPGVSRSELNSHPKTEVSK